MLMAVWHMGANVSFLLVHPVASKFWIWFWVCFFFFKTVSPYVVLDAQQLAL